MTFASKEELSNFVQSLAEKYFDELAAHGYEPPPYDGSQTPDKGFSRKPCCTLPMMWSAFEKLGIVAMKDSGRDFDPDPTWLFKSGAMKEAAGEIADKQETHMLNEAAVLHILQKHLCSAHDGG